MVVHIAPIGKNVAHVKEWLREVQPITKVWLIHSKKSDDYNFPKAAKDLAKKIQAVDVNTVVSSVINTHLENGAIFTLNNYSVIQKNFWEKLYIYFK